MGLGAVAAGALTISDDDFTVAAFTLASLVSEAQLAKGCAYPPLEEIRDVSLKIAVAVATNIIQSGRAAPEVAQELNSYSAILEQVQWMVYEPMYDY